MGGRWKPAFDAMHPDGPSVAPWRVGVPESRLRTLTDHGHVTKLYRLALVEQVVSDPTGIIQGWDRPEMDGCYVYVGRPQVDRRGPGIETSAPSGMLFLVFVLPDGTIDEWNWRPAMANEPDWPIDVKGRRVWP